MKDEVALLPSYFILYEARSEEMQVQVERLGEGEARMKISLGSEAVAQEIERVFKEAARNVQIPGFRRGRAPRALVEARVDMEVVRREALDRLTQLGYLEAIAETRLEPIDRARVEERNLREDGSFTFRATVFVMPEVKLGPYRGLKATRIALPVSDEAVEAELERIRRRRISYVSAPERAIEKGDVAIIDYDLEVDGRSVEEGGVKGYPLEVGSDSLFPELNEGLLGAKPGEVRRLQSRLPQSHPDPALADREAVFVITVKEVKTPALPELNDEFARKVAGVQSLEELRQQVREALERLSAQEAEFNLRENLISQVAEASEVEVPRLLVERFVEARESETTRELEEGMEGYLARRGLTYASWKKGVEAEARRHLKRHLVVREIVRKEGLTIAEEEIEAEISRLAEREGITAAAKRRALEANDGIRDLADRLLREKALRLLVDCAEIEVEEAETGAAGQREAREHGKQ